MALMIIQPLLELYIRSSPFRIHSPAWRLTLIGNVSGALSAPILALFLTLALAIALEDRGVTYLVSSVSAAAAVLSLAATGLFALDALQMRSQVQADLSDSYGLASMWVAAKLVMAVIVLLALSVSAFRAAQGVRRSTSPAGKSSVLVGATGRTPVGVRAAVDADTR